jgi:predicted PurR-regulated permease PerM
METMYFISGIVLVVVVAMAAATIWSILRIIKNQKTTEHLQRDLNDITADIHRQQKEMERDMYDAIQNQVMTLERQLSMMHELIDNSKRYTDSRIDKIMNDPKFCLNSQAKKQLND